jgi:hypothetical protein
LDELGAHVSNVHLQILRPALDADSCVDQYTCFFKPLLCDSESGACIDKVEPDSVYRIVVGMTSGAGSRGGGTADNTYQMCLHDLIKKYDAKPNKMLEQTTLDWDVTLINRTLFLSSKGVLSKNVERGGGEGDNCVVGTCSTNIRNFITSGGVKC